MTSDPPLEDLPTNLERQLALFKKKARDWNDEADRYMAQRDELLVALKDIVEDLEARWDMRDPRTNPGIRDCVANAKAAIAKVEQ